MIDVKQFFEELQKNDINFFTGVPDSLLKDICAYITANTSKENHVITANEGSAIGLGVGYNLATNKIPLVYMQNSGMGNTINPLLSLADKQVYAIPMIMMIGWRGEPNVKDEPQHIKQGRVTPAMLESMEIPFEILDANSDYQKIIKSSIETAKDQSGPVVILVRKGTFASYKLEEQVSQYEMTREEALENIVAHIPKDAVIVSTTGKLSRELFELRVKKNESHQTDFLTVGSMGHTSQIALGIALAKPEQQVFCFDGDGSAIMHLGNYAVIGSLQPKNLKTIIFNNAAHDSVGGQPTVGEQMNFIGFAKSVNLKSYGPVKTKEEIDQTMPSFLASKETAFMEVKIKTGARSDLGRPTNTPIENKTLLQKFLHA